MKSNYFQNEFAELRIEENVLFFIYKPGIEISLEGARQIVLDRLNFQKGVSYPVFCDMRGVKDCNKPARDYLAKEGSTHVKAVALLTDSAITKLMASFYLTISRPLVLTKMFADKNQALEFLKAYTM